VTETTPTAVSTSIHRGRARRACLHRVHRGHGELVAGGPPHSAGAVGVHGVRAASRWSRLRRGRGRERMPVGPRPVHEPPHRVVFSWDISLQWQVEQDLARTSEVEVRFIAESPARTRVEFEHPPPDRHGEGWEACATRWGLPKVGTSACRASSGAWSARPRPDPWRRRQVGDRFSRTRRSDIGAGRPVHARAP